MDDHTDTEDRNEECIDRQAGSVSEDTLLDGARVEGAISPVVLLGLLRRHFFSWGLVGVKRQMVEMLVLSLFLSTCHRIARICSRMEKTMKTQRGRCSLIY